jgi:hypothetical protein
MPATKPRAYTSDAFIRRMVALAREMGMDPGGFEVTRDGTVRVLPKPASDRTKVDEWLDQN